MIKQISLVYWLFRVFPEELQGDLFEVFEVIFGEFSINLSDEFSGSIENSFKAQFFFFLCLGVFLEVFGGCFAGYWEVIWQVFMGKFKGKLD